MGLAHVLGALLECRLDPLGARTYCTAPDARFDTLSTITVFGVSTNSSFLPAALHTSDKKQSCLPDLPYFLLELS